MLCCEFFQRKNERVFTATKSEILQKFFSKAESIATPQSQRCEQDIPKIMCALGLTLRFFLLLPNLCECVCMTATTKLSAANFLKYYHTELTTHYFRYFSKCSKNLASSYNPQSASGSSSSVSLPLFLS